MLFRIAPSRYSYKLLRQQRANWWLRGCAGLVLGLGAWLGYKEIKQLIIPPEAILVLGGSPSREVFAAAFAREHPKLEIWVSSGSNPEYSEWVFAQAGINSQRIHLDYQAVDTVTNFTTLVDEFKAKGIDNIYLITSDDHMRRAQVIGAIVFGSRGIEFQPIQVPSGRQPEPIEKAIRDGARSLFWVMTGETGAEFRR